MNENDLFNYIRDCLYPDLVKARNQMSRWDCYSPMFRHRIELKCRRKHYDTLLLEKKKYDAMIMEAIKNDDTPMYINSTPQGVYSFDLLEIEPVWEIKHLSVTTEFASNATIDKQVCFLHIDDAVEL